MLVSLFSDISEKYVSNFNYKLVNYTQLYTYNGVNINYIKKKTKTGIKYANFIW